MADDVTRISRKLHLRRPRAVIGLVGALLLEAFAAIVGGVLVAAAVKERSTVCAIVGLALWIASFEPLLKVGVGTALGVAYDYAYLYGGLEPRFKTMLGSYFVLPPLRRALVQFAGALGSPVAALIAAQFYAPTLPIARIIAWLAFWILALINFAGVVAEIAGLHRIGNFGLPPGSANEMVVELRCWWRTRCLRKE